MPLRLLFPVTWSPLPPNSATCLLCQPRGSLFFLPLSQFYPRKPVHTEICFLNWFKAQKAFLAKNLSHDEKYHITWFMSWSPCFNCARRVVEFLSEHRHVELSIVAARIYYSNGSQYQQGLRSLESAGAHVAIMSQDGESRGSWAGTWESPGPGRKDLESPEEEEPQLAACTGAAGSGRHRRVSWRREFRGDRGSRAGEGGKDT